MFGKYQIIYLVVFHRVIEMVSILFRINRKINEKKYLTKSQSDSII